MTRCFIPLQLDNLIAWWRLGEIMLAKSQLFLLSSNVPLINNDRIFFTLLGSLPNVVDLRTIVIAEIRLESVDFFKQSPASLLNIDSVISIFPLDARHESFQYIHSVIPTVPLHKQSFLNLPLSLVCAKILQQNFIKSEKANQRLKLNFWRVLKGYFMRKKSNKYYLPVLLESLVAWRRIGEILLYEELVLKFPQELELPLSQLPELEQLKTVLPRFENIRNLVVIEISSTIFEQSKDFDRYIDYKFIKAIYPLDSAEKSYSYLQSLVPSIEIQTKSFLDKRLSNKLVEWSEQRNALLAAEKMLSLLEKPYADNHLMGKLWESVLEVVVMNDLPIYAEGSKIQSFLYSLFFYSRNSMKSEFRYEDLGLVDDMAKILKEAIPRETIMTMGLDYKKTLETLKVSHRSVSLSTLIIEIRNSHQQITKGLFNYYQLDVFIPALVFLKLKNMHLDQDDADQFYEFIMDLHTSGCDKNLLATGVVWFAALYGFIELQDLYNQLNPKAPFFIEKQIVQVTPKTQSDHPAIKEKAVESTPIAKLVEQPLLLASKDLDKGVFIIEGNVTFYAVIDDSGQYQINESKGKKYKLVNKSQLREKINVWPEGQLRMRKESSPKTKPSKPLKDVQGIEG